mmetsp:Transcript_2402/g.6453  ORF Transcript_2402/g.6453 Transcript_2402/m.6453 type:complete len:205 (+) Transcript_2402:643-1257(+)
MAPWLPSGEPIHPVHRVSEIPRYLESHRLVRVFRSLIDPGPRFLFSVFSSSFVLEGDEVHHVVGAPWDLEDGVLEVRFEDDLAAEPGRLLGVVGQVDHVLLGFRGFPHLFEPVGMDDDVARRAGHDPAAGALDHLAQDVRALAVSEFGDVRQRHVLEALDLEGPLEVVLHLRGVVVVVVVVLPRGPGGRREDPDPDRLLAPRPG